MRRPIIGFLVTLSSLALAMEGTPAAAQTVNACIGKKIACVATFAGALEGCYAKAAKGGKALDPSCTLKAAEKFGGATKGCIAKAEKKGGCVTTSDTGALAASVNDLVADLVAALDPGFPTLVKNKCTGGKHGCVATKVKGLLKCRVAAAKKGTLDATCVQKAIAKFDGGPKPEKACFTKLESKGGCVTTGDLAALETRADAFVLEIACALDPATTGCDASTPTPTPPGSTPTLTPSATGITPTPTPSASPSATRTATPSPTVTRTVTPTASTTAPAPTATNTPGGGGCPTSYEFTVDPTTADRDFGWTGVSHDRATNSNIRFTMSISGCQNAAPPCGTCSLSGPVTNGGGVGFANRRCRGDNSGANGSWIQCTSDGQCPGTNNACVYFAGAPESIAEAGLALCATNEIVGAMTGTVNPTTGAAAFGLGFRQLTYNGVSLTQACPACVSGTCQGGARNGQACVVSGTSALFGNQNVSLDCPPSGLITATGQLVRLSVDTATQTKTLSANNPQCGSDRCFCGVCNDAAATPCGTNADCVAVGATTCGLKRCAAGTNALQICSTNSECPGSSCAQVGAPPKPNNCVDDTNSPAPNCADNTPPDNDSIDEGTCTFGTAFKRCAIEQFRTGCLTSAECPAPGDSCVVVPRECFADNGVLGGTISVGGVASPTAPTLGAIGCMSASGSAALNTATGMPGPVRLTLPGTAVLQ